MTGEHKRHRIVELAGKGSGVQGLLMSKATPHSGQRGGVAFCRWPVSEKPHSSQRGSALFGKGWLMHLTLLQAAYITKDVCRADVANGVKDRV